MTSFSPPPKYFYFLREELTPILLFQKIAEERKIPNSFYEATITLIQNQTEMAQKKKTTGQYH